MATHGMSAGELLLGCLLNDPGSASLAEHEWHAVIREAVRQGVTPLLCDRLPTLDRTGDVPTRVIQALRELAIGSAAKCLQLHHDLVEILSVLTREGIDVIVLKGAYLSHKVYANKVLRPMRDIDLMVRRRDLMRAQAALREMGYAQAPGHHAEWDCSRSHHLDPLTRPGGARVEIHWTIERPNAPFAIDVEELWARAQPCTIGGVDVLALSTEDLVLHVCVHTAFHHRLEYGLRGCWDTLEIIRRRGEDIDWDQVHERAVRWGARRYVYLTLSLAKDLLGAGVPVQVLAALRPAGFDSRVLRWARAEVLGPSADPSISSRFAMFWGATRMREKALLLVEGLFPSKTVMAGLYPGCHDPRWLSVFYLVHWARLVRSYGRTIWRMILGDQSVKTSVRREHQRAVLIDWLQPTQFERPST
jgi:Uncharacterised nucleotidyltransferase